LRQKKSSRNNMIYNVIGKCYIFIFELHSPTVTEQLKQKYKMEKCLGDDKTILCL